MWVKLGGVVFVLSLSLFAAANDNAAQIARGRYVFLLADCNGCHSVHDNSRLGWPVAPGGFAKGQVMPAELGLPGRVVAPNITQDKETGIGAWTDQEILSAVRGGIGRDGRTLFPMMPYMFFRSMSDSDAKALVAYLRTIPPASNRLPRTELPPGMKLPPPPPVASVPQPSPSNRVRYGEYLVTVAACLDCHTPAGADHAPDRQRRFAGGTAFKFPGGIQVVSANITPDPETGIGSWTEQQFLNRFAVYKQYAKDLPPQIQPDQFTIMPWLGFSQLTRDDLGAIYAYLRTVPPVKNKAITHPKPEQQAANLQ
jgi:hypothetical protein